MTAVALVAKKKQNISYKDKAMTLPENTCLRYSLRTLAMLCITLPKIQLENIGYNTTCLRHSLRTLAMPLPV